MKVSWSVIEDQLKSIWRVEGVSTEVPKCMDWKPGCWRRVEATEERTAAPGLEGSPMEVPGRRGMRAISVVGILKVGGLVVVVVDGVVRRYGGSRWWKVVSIDLNVKEFEEQDYL